MTIEKLKRVMWRARKESKDNGKTITRAQLKRCIMLECGVHPSTYYNNKAALIALGWLRAVNKVRYRLTDVDLTDY